MRLKSTLMLWLSSDMVAVALMGIRAHLIQPLPALLRRFDPKSWACSIH
jgi:hypothetical protein